MQTNLGTYDTRAEAEQAMEQLVRAGTDRSRILLQEQEDERGFVLRLQGEGAAPADAVPEEEHAPGLRYADMGDPQD